MPRCLSMLIAISFTPSNEVAARGRIFLAASTHANKQCLCHSLRIHIFQALGIWTASNVQRRAAIAFRRRQKRKRRELLFDVDHARRVVADVEQLVQTLRGFRSAQKKMATWIEHPVDVGDDLLLQITGKVNQHVTAENDVEL